MREPPPIEETATSRFVTICFPTVPAPFNVFVATFQTSAASVPNDESVRVLLAQTAVGMVAARDELAVRTVELVFELIVETADETCEFVLALMTAAVAGSASIPSCSSSGTIILFSASLRSSVLEHS
mgnify:CR=1 FL=1